MSAAPGRQWPEATVLRQATASPQGLAVSGLSPKQANAPSGSRRRYSGDEGLHS